MKARMDARLAKLSTTSRIRRQARQLCNHTIVFTEATDKMIVVRAMQGRTTESIAEEFGLTPTQVQYRIVKAQKSLKARFRSDYRNGHSEIAAKMIEQTTKIAMHIVEKDIAPKFIPFARSGVPLSS